MENALIAEILLRGGAASVALVTAVMMAFDRSFPARAGVFFGLGTAAYALVSSPTISSAVGMAAPLLIALAKLNSVFFWIFAIALFDDAFRWRTAALVPIAALLAIDLAASAGLQSSGGELLRRLVVAALAVHVLVTVLRDYRSDLVDARRRLRAVLVFGLGLAALAVAAGEIAAGAEWVDAQALRPLQAATLWALASAFLIASARLRPSLFPQSARKQDVEDVAMPDTAQATVGSLSPRDRAVLTRLESAIAEGALFEEGMSIGRLAERVGAPEHRLRKIINSGLGFRNFSAFLNASRIPRAQALLADPAQAEMQITQIALEVGFASLGPFNRAFREQTGMAPSEWRARQIQGGGQDRGLADSEKD